MLIIKPTSFPTVPLGLNLPYFPAKTGDRLKGSVKISIQAHSQAIELGHTLEIIGKKGVADKTKWWITGLLDKKRFSAYEKQILKAKRRADKLPI